MANKCKQFIINDESFFEDLIWMSMRYCIGRRSIAANCHPGNIIKNCYNQLSDEMKERLVTDIRREIDNQLSWYSNIKVNNKYDDDNTDIAYLIGYALSTYDPDELLWKDTKFIVDKRSKIVNIESELDCAQYKITQILYDFLPWSKLANALDKNKHKVLVVKNGDELKELVCFPYVSEVFSAESNYSYRILWCTVDRYVNNSYVDSFIDPEAIVEIKD